MNKIRINSIGIVRSSYKRGDREYKVLCSDLIINKEFKEALDGLDEFSHIYVLYWMHKVSKKQLSLKVHPWGNEELPLLGVFATRAPSRPNPIGLTLVELVKMDKNENRLTVRGLDALDGSPIIDIKPYDLWDVEEYNKIRIPTWWKKAKPKIWAKWRRLRRCFGEK